MGVSDVRHQQLQLGVAYCHRVVKTGLRLLMYARAIVICFASIIVWNLTFASSMSSSHELLRSCLKETADRGETQAQ